MKTRPGAARPREPAPLHRAARIGVAAGAWLALASAWAAWAMPAQPQPQPAGRGDDPHPAVASPPPRAPAAAPLASLTSCRLQGVAHEARCGVVKRPLDPLQPEGPQIDIHFAVLPALARRKKEDPVFFFAGGPGQSAVALSGTLDRPLARLINRRDVVLIDQRGTGRSAPLRCPQVPPTQPLRELANPLAQAARLRECRAALEKLPHGDLRQYTTTIAMADVEAVRQALGAPPVNLVGGSYGTRAALEYLRQYPQAVRRVVLDGVAPPDMVLPASFSTDAQAALEALFAACEADRGVAMAVTSPDGAADLKSGPTGPSPTACATHYPQLRSQWAALLKSLPREVTVPHPYTGREERLMLTREAVSGLVRPPLYAPLLASALPLAVSEASQGRFTPLLGLSMGLAGGGGRAMQLAEGMHFSVICAEDLPRLRSGTSADRPGTDFGEDFAALYRRVCEGWPQGAVPAAFYQVPATTTPVLVLSGGLDPVTPARHGQRVAQALGPQARHVVVPNAGHGLMLQGCLRDLVFRFIDAPDDAAAQRVDAGCAQRVPRPPAFVMPGTAEVPAAAGPGGVPRS
ncbi:MAG: alpha/beta fold hydrolase [Betaproteobacteria bacterium]